MNDMSLWSDIPGYSEAPRSIEGVAFSLGRTAGTVPKEYRHSIRSYLEEKDKEIRGMITKKSHVLIGG